MKQQQQQERKEKKIEKRMHERNPGEQNTTRNIICIVNSLCIPFTLRVSQSSLDGFPVALRVFKATGESQIKSFKHMIFCLFPLLAFVARLKREKKKKSIRKHFGSVLQLDKVSCLAIAYNGAKYPYIAVYFIF